MLKKIALLFCLFSPEISSAQSLYFPPLVGKTWENVDMQKLGWCTDYVDSLYNYLYAKNTKGFLVLKDGKIVLEKYFGTFSPDSFWDWASAGKTVTGFMVGIAQQKSLLSITDASSTYLGKGWTSEVASDEAKILVKNQLSMTSGLDDNGVNKDCTEDSCLVFKATAGTRWAYHNAPYTLLDKVIEAASGQSFQQFFNTELRNKTGINGLWLKSDFNNVLYSNMRSMGRFGLLLLNKGKWDQTVLLSDSAYFGEMTNSSQALNPSYGYLTWLNGKSKLMVPTSQVVFNTALAPNAPSDMYAAMGKNGQLINVVPSQNLVMVRIGDAPGDNGEVPITFNNEIWFHLNKVICGQSNALNGYFGSNQIELFPNPVKGVLQLRGILPGEILGLSLYSVEGALQEHFEPAVQLNLGDLEQGIYFLHIETVKGRVVRKLSYEF
jgi:CubicO group peptidase (beta-lactamase class C family)